MAPSGITCKCQRRFSSGLLGVVSENTMGTVVSYTGAGFETRGNRLAVRFVELFIIVINH